MTTGTRLAAGALATCAVLVAVPTAGVAEPANIAEQRAQVQRLEAQLADIDAQAGRAAEAYNGARWRQQQIEGRIEVNTRRTTDTTKRLKRSQATLAERLRGMYANPEPSLVEIVASSGSVVSAIDSAQLLERIGRRDGATVVTIRTDLGQLKRARVQLGEDRAAVKVQVTEAARHREQVLTILAQRKRLVEGARGELRTMLAAEERRKRREAEEQRRRAEEAQRAIAAAERRNSPSAPSSPAAPSSPSAPASPSSPASSPSSPAPSAPPSSSGNAAAVQVAMRYLGVPYVWGGASPSGFDCSGLVSYAYGQIGKSVPHYTGAIWAAFPKVPSSDLQPGDLVFFYSDLHHVGMYIGNGQFIHAPHTGDVVKISSLSERASVYAGAVRP